jgi:hypothetical protein
MQLSYGLRRGRRYDLRDAGCYVVGGESISDHFMGPFLGDTVYAPHKTNPPRGARRCIFIACVLARATLQDLPSFYSQLTTRNV